MSIKKAVIPAAGLGIADPYARVAQEAGGGP